MVSARGLCVDFAGRRTVRALDQVSVEIPGGAIIGLTGSSGCGKSTLARCLSGWQVPSAGSIVRRALVQLVMQDPGGSLNPRFTAYEVVEEPLRIAGPAEGRKRVAGTVQAMLERVGIAQKQASKRSGEFSGGEKARLAIARAFAAMPAPGLLILDESLIGLDVTTRDEILQLLRGFAEDGAVVLISHDRELLDSVCGRVIRMEAGKVLA